MGKCGKWAGEWEEIGRFCNAKRERQAAIEHLAKKKCVLEVMLVCSATAMK